LSGDSNLTLDFTKFQSVSHGYQELHVQFQPKELMQVHHELAINLHFEPDTSSVESHQENPEPREAIASD
jgi:hypothetical protein